MKKVFILLFVALLASHAFAAKGRFQINLSDMSWRLWPDSLAAWQDDTLHLPPTDLSVLPVNQPTGGWAVLETAGIEVTLPAVIEEYFLGPGTITQYHKGDYKGVMWFTTQLQLPKDIKNKRVALLFESIRQRAEVYVDGRIAGYDIIGNTPFNVDITPFVKGKQTIQLAIRVTDPGGGFSWEDWDCLNWGKYQIPESHGFGGITGHITLSVTDPLYIDDLYIQNQPSVTTIMPQVTLSKKSSGKLTYTLFDETKEVFRTVQAIKEIQTAKLPIPYPEAREWSPDSPNLYTLKVEWNGNDGSYDCVEKPFGFRWFNYKDVNGDRQLFLNGERTFLLSAISWSFWPVNGIYPTPEMAEKNILAAKAYGMNMLNFHRNIGQPELIRQADRLGLLLYEEPGGYAAIEKISEGNDSSSPFARSMAREKLLRMVIRDRSHPSIIIYSLINEACRDPKPQHIEDMKEAHRLDPSRFITYSSNTFEYNYFSQTDGTLIYCPLTPHVAKSYMEPLNDSVLIQGWWDEHHAVGPGCYIDTKYNSPTDYYLYTTHASEVIFYGEEGSIGVPGRVELIANQMNRKKPGWDGAHHLDLYENYRRLLNEPSMRGLYPSVDSFTVDMGNLSHYYQGRAIENARINNLTDGYAINGWEPSIPGWSYFSGIVDLYRNPKGNVELVAHYNQPLYVAVKLREKVMNVDDTATADIFIVNRNKIKGEATLTLNWKDEKGKVLKTEAYPVTISGGNLYGELLKEAVTCSGLEEGYTLLEAQIAQNGMVQAEGNDRLYAVALPKDDIPKEIYLPEGDLCEKFICSLGIKPLDFANAKPERCDLLIGSTMPTHRLAASIAAFALNGGRIILLSNADEWVKQLNHYLPLSEAETYPMPPHWIGGAFIATNHPFLTGLPKGVMNWPMQVFARGDNDRRSLKIEGGETAVWMIAAENPDYGKSLLTLPYGKGELVINSLDILPQIESELKASVTAKRLLINLLR